MGNPKSGDAQALRIPAKPEITKAPHQDRRKFCVIPWEAVQDRELPASSLRYLAAFAAYANPAGITWVGLKKVGQDLGVSQVAVFKHLTKIKARGYMEDIGNAFRGEKAKTRRIIYSEDITADDAISLNSSKEDCRPPEQIRKEEKEMARKKKTEATQETRSVNCEEVKQSEKPSLEEGIRWAYCRVVNVDENALKWLGMALELGATRSMLEACSREASPVGAVKVLVTRLDAACR